MNDYLNPWCILWCIMEMVINGIGTWQYM